VPRRRARRRSRRSMPRWGHRQFHRSRCRQPETRASSLFVIFQAWKREGGRDAPPPKRRDRHLGDAGAFMRMDHAVHARHDADVLCRNVLAKAKENHVAVRETAVRTLNEMATRSLEQ